MCGPHNFQGKPKLNKKEKVRFREEPLGWADWMFLGSAPPLARKTINMYRGGSCGDLLLPVVTQGNRPSDETPAVKLMR